MPYILAIDLGSGGPKVALVSDRGEIVAATRRSTSLVFLADGGVEQEPEGWWRAVSSAAGELLAERRVPPEQIVAVACAAQWSVTTPVDAAGQPLMNAVHWLDRRGGPHSQKLMDGWPKIAGYDVFKLWRWLRLTASVPLDSGADALSHVLFIKHERPDVYAAADKFLEPCDYLGLRLTGRRASSFATSFPLCLADNRDCRAVRYSPPLLEASGVDVGKLPELAPVDAVLGSLLPRVADDWGLPRGTPVLIGSGDSHAAVFGSGAIRDFQPHLCLGTSAWITCLLPWRRVDVLHGLTTMPAIVPGKYMLMAEQGAAGKLIEHFVERWFSDGQSWSSLQWAERYDALLSEAGRVAAGAGGLLFLPWFNGSGPPQQDGRMRGGFLNLTVEAGPPQALRAVLEGVACNLRWLAERLERFLGRPIRELNFIGGGARSPVLAQALADCLGRPIHQVADPTYAIARGAALAALVSLRRLGLDEVPDKAPIARSYEPNAERRAVYDETYRRFLDAFRATRKLYHRWPTAGGLRRGARWPRPSG